jgi:hypothetical protein
MKNERSREYQNTRRANSSEQLKKEHDMESDKPRLMQGTVRITYPEATVAAIG